jgi:hypothetical protein
MVNKKTFENKLVRHCKKIRAIMYLGNTCGSCQEDNVHRLTFSYLKYSPYNLNVTKLIRSSSWSSIRVELDKCELLCYNCHIAKKVSLTEETDDTKRRKIIKRYHLKLKGDNGCAKCSYNECDEALDFYHTGEYKGFSIGSKRMSKSNVEEVSEEISKCDIYCRNCRMEAQTDVAFFEENILMIFERIAEYKELTKIDRDKILKLHMLGLKQIQIANLLKCSKSRISEIFKELCLE